MNSAVRQMGDWLRGRAYPSHGWGHKFESCIAHHRKDEAAGNSGLFSNMRKPLSIGMFVRARFETGLFHFPSGEPAERSCAAGEAAPMAFSYRLSAFVKLYFKV